MRMHGKSAQLRAAGALLLALACTQSQAQLLTPKRKSPFARLENPIAGLRARMTEMSVSGLRLGETYNLRTLKNLPYILENRGEKSADVEVLVTRPSAESLREGYEPVPDPSWINVMPRKFTVPIGGSAFGEIMISLPGDPRWANRHFQATITSRSPGGSKFPGVDTVLTFSAGEPPVIEKKQVVVPEFEVEPAVLSMRDFPVGRKVDAEREFHRFLRVINKSPAKLRIGFERVGFGPVDIPASYEQAPSSATFSLAANSLTVDPDSIKRLGFSVELPPTAHGKRYAFLLRTVLQDFPLEVLGYVTVLIDAENRTP